MVASQYTVIMSGRERGSTLPHDTASDGVAPESPPVSGRASVTCK